MDPSHFAWYVAAPADFVNGSGSKMSIAGQKGVMSIVYGAIVVAILMVFIIQFRPNASQQTGSIKQQCVVTVRGRCIDPKEFWASYSLLVPRGVDESQLKKMGLRRHVMEGLVERVLLTQDAERLKLAISEEEINAEITKGRLRISLPQEHAAILAMNLNMMEPGVRLYSFEAQNGKGFDYKTYQRIIKQTTNRSEKEFKAMQREELIAERMRDLVRSRARITDAEAFDAFVRERSTATLDYFRFRRAWFVAHYIDASPKVVEEWAAGHKEELDKSWESYKKEFPPGCRTARHILVKLQSDTQPDGHPRAEAEELAAKALQRIKGGEDFAAVAADLSEDEGSAPRGGSLGCFLQEGKLVKSFEDAAFALKNPGDLAEKVETQFGLHIIQLEGILSTDPQKAEAEGRQLIAAEVMKAMRADELMAATAKEALAAAQGGKTLAQAVDEALIALEQKVRPKAKDDDKAKVAAAADKARPKLETTEPFGPEGRPFPDAARDTNVASIAFKLEKPGQIASDLVKLMDGYAIVQLKEKKAATREQFDQDRDAFVERLRRRKGDDMLAAYIARLRNQARTETLINEGFAKDPQKAPEGED